MLSPPTKRARAGGVAVVVERAVGVVGALLQERGERAFEARRLLQAGLDEVGCGVGGAVEQLDQQAVDRRVVEGEPAEVEQRAHQGDREPRAEQDEEAANECVGIAAPRRRLARGRAGGDRPAARCCRDLRRRHVRDRRLRHGQGLGALGEPARIDRHPFPLALKEMGDGVAEVAELPGPGEFGSRVADVMLVHVADGHDVAEARGVLGASGLPWPELALAAAIAEPIAKQ